MNSSKRFYKHLFAFPETAGFLHDPALVERLKKMQRKHLQSMLQGEHNEAYAEQRRKVGDVHAHVGLDPRSSWRLQPISTVRRTAIDE